ncbi:MAG: diguanylate cyclase [Clostridiales bacterium]|nr:diguanylate cyclase [Clostridiales bacterium]
MPIGILELKTETADSHLHKLDDREAMWVTTNESILAKELLWGLPFFICVVDEKNHNILFANQKALDVLGENIEGEYINRVRNGNTLLLNAGEKSGNRLEYNSRIDGAWYWISHYSIEREGSKLHVFSGVGHNDIERLDSLPDLADKKEVKAPSAESLLEKQLIECRQRGAHSLSVCYVDIDNLKAVNDNLGWAEGDEYVNAVMEVIKSAIRRTDIFSRLEGDEFLLAFPNCSYKVVENIMGTVVTKLDMINEANGCSSYSISYGIIEVDDIGDADAQSMLKAVKNSMYKMKAESKE